MDRVELIIALSGDKQALDSLRNLEKAIKTISDKKIQVRIDLAETRKHIASLRKEISDQEAILKIDPDDEKAKAEIEHLKQELASARQRAAELAAELGLIGAGLAGAREEAKNFNDNLDPVQAKLNDIADAADRLSTAFSTLSSMSGAIGDLAGGIGDAFSGMAGIFDIDFINTIERSLTYLGTKAVVGNVEKVTSRYDILKTFTDYLEITGVTADKANESLQRINESILGLPIGLDESAYRLRRYQMLLGDIDQATNLTIGLQRAIIAGGANEQMRTQAYYQIDRLLSSGKLTQARQWFSLINGLGVSISFLAEEMGFGGMKANEAAAALVAGLSSGEIPVRDFLDALASLGEGTSEASQKLERALEIYKGTLESWLSNINFAMIRGGANVLDALNTALISGTNISVTGYMKEFRDGLNEMYKAVAKWTTSNPKAFSDTILAFRMLLDSAKGINAGQIAGGMLNNLGRVFDMISTALNRLPDGKLEEFVSFATTIAGPMGKLFSAVQDGMPAMLAVFDRFDDFNFERLTQRLFTEVERLATVYSGLLHLIPDGMMTELLTFGLVYAKPVANGFSSIANGLGTLATSIRALTGNWDDNILTSLRRFAGDHPKLAMAGKSLGVLSAALLTLYAAYAQRQAKRASLYEELGLDESEKIAQSAGRVVGVLDNLKESYSTALASIDQKAGLGKQLADEIVEINNALASAEGTEDFNNKFIDLASAVSRLNELFPDLNIQIDESTGMLTEQSAAALEGRDALIEYAAATEKAAAALEYLKSLDTQSIQLEVSLAAVTAEIEELDATIAALRAESPEMTGGQRPRGDADNTLKIDEVIKQRGTLTQKQQELTAALEETSRQQEAAKAIVEEATAAEGQYAEAVANSTEAVKNQIQGLTDAYKKLKEESEKTINSQVAGFGKLEEAAATGLSEVQKGLESDTKVIQSYNENMEEILKYLTENRGKIDSETLTFASWLSANGLDNADLVAGFAEAVKNMDETAIQEAVKAYDEKMAEVAKATEATAFMQAIADKPEEFLNNMEIEDFGDFGSFGEKMVEVLGKSVEEAFASGDNVLNNIGTMMADAIDLEAFREQFSEGIGEDGLMNVLGISEEEVQSQLDSLTVLQEGILTAAETMGLALNGEEESLGGAFSAVNDWITRLAEESAPLLMETVSMVGEAVTTFYENAVEGLRAKLEETEEQTKKLEEAIIKLANTMNAKTPTVDAFTSAMDRLRAMVGEAERAVIALREAINSLQDKEVTVTYVENHVGGFSGGGMVQYRAIGGSIFKPRGTDTVPAMLTPGEFVIRRDAVNKFGAPFLQMINRLDIPNAIDALMSGVNMPTMGGYVTYDNRRTYDNHATVNQNIYTNNLSYTYRRASRWANAL